MIGVVSQDLGENGQSVLTAQWCPAVYNVGWISDTNGTRQLPYLTESGMVGFDDKPAVLRVLCSKGVGNRQNWSAGDARCL